MSNLLKAALFYREKFGFSVIPTKGKIANLVSWEKYQHEKADESQINEWWSKWPDANIAIVTGKISGITVLDIDWYKNEINKDEINKLFPVVATPSVTSGHGGEHRYFEYDADIPTRNDILTGLDVKNDGGVIVAPPSVNGNIYKWNENTKIGELSLRSFPEKYKDSISILINNISLYKATQLTTPQTTTKATIDHNYFTEGRRDEDLFTIANTLTKARLDPVLVKQTLELIANNLGEEFGPKTVDIKIKSAMQRVDRQERSIATEAKDWVLSQPGHFRLQEGHNELTLTTINHKKAFNMAIARLCEGENPIIKKYGKQRGVYIRLENDLEEINWRSANGGEMKFEWMMGFSQYIKTMPKTIYVIAGDPDAGKSAVCLNLAIQNCRAMKVAYFSSEMGPEELGSRIRLYDDLDENLVEKNINFYERDNNFEDVIKPNHINIVDYYEISKDFWEIAESLKQIRHNLDKGIAIVAVQKKRGATLGRGSEFGLEKPRLYMRIEPHKDKSGCLDGNIITIEKAKNWRDPNINPNGLSMKFKLVKGINMIPTFNDWLPEIDQKYKEFRKG